MQTEALGGGVTSHEKVELDMKTTGDIGKSRQNKVHLL